MTSSASRCSCSVLALGQVAAAAAGAADVHPGARVAAGGQVRVQLVVAGEHRVVLAVGQVLEERGESFAAIRALGVLGQVEGRGEANAVGHRDPVADDPHAL